MEIQMPMTDIQSKVFGYIIRYLFDKRYPPTITEIQAELGFANPGSVSCALDGLEKKNYIYRNGKKVPRNIRLTELGEEIYRQETQPTLFEQAPNGTFGNV